MNERVQADVRKQNNPELLKQMEWLWKKRRAQLVHRGKGNEVKQAKQWPAWTDFRKQNKLAVQIVEWWVRGPNGAPGLMFFRNEAMAELLKFYLTQQNLTSGAVKKVRQQVGLIPVGNKKHFVWSYIVKSNNKESWNSAGYQQNNKLAFSGVLKRKNVLPN